MSERDWQVDWELCWPHGGCVAPPPWKVEDRTVWYKGIVAWHPLVYGSRCTQHDLQFITEAREALPYWLQRVQELEEENARLKALAALEEVARMSERDQVQILKDEVERLQGALVEAWCICRQRAPRHSKLLTDVKQVVRMALGKEENNG